VCVCVYVCVCACECVTGSPLLRGAAQSNSSEIVLISSTVESQAIASTGNRGSIGTLLGNGRGGAPPIPSVRGLNSTHAVGYAPHDQILGGHYNKSEQGKRKVVGGWRGEREVVGGRVGWAEEAAEEALALVRNRSSPHSATQNRDVLLMSGRAAAAQSAAAATLSVPKLRMPALHHPRLEDHRDSPRGP